MSLSAFYSPNTNAHSNAREAVEGASHVPWECRILVFAATCIFIGITWDISWHQTIGRDTFWTPAHMVIYVGGALAGLCGGWRVLDHTFRNREEARHRLVRIWGFYGSIGSWVAIWGSLAMLISAPFDNWWHNAYGLDVMILSPPHTLLAAGMHHIVVGALLMVVSLQNRSRDGGTSTGRSLFLYAGGVMLALAAIILTEFSFANQQRTATFYSASALLYPVLLVSMARASPHRFAATITALVYTGLKLATIWILPLFPATPMLAPIYTPLTSMVPPTFPLLLVVPALGVDLVFGGLGKGVSLRRALVTGLLAATVFLGLFVVTQWYFSQFLISPAADNWFFAGNRNWSYNTPQGDWRTRYWRLDRDPVTWVSMGRAWMWAWFSTTIGLVWGFWMSRVKR